jgi:pyruvate/2-oxoglutarate dehydrogenase complex dihydrolipoamide acyltransferase (E2) component
MRKLFVYLGLSLIATSLNSLFLSAEASVPQQSYFRSSSRNYVAIAGADQAATAKKTNALLTANGIFARKIAAHLGIESAAKTPPEGDIFQQNLFLILQNQDTFRAIAEKVGATAAPAGAVEGADQSAKNHSILLTNKKIVGQILKKLGITPTPPTLTGTFEEKNVTLLMGNRKALDKIAAKLGVK